MSSIVSIVFERLKQDYLKTLNGTDKEKYFFSLSENLIGFDNEDFSFLDPQVGDADFVRKKIQSTVHFSHMVNHVPRNSYWGLTSSMELVKNYQKIIEEAKLASPVADEKKVFNQAKAFLYKSFSSVIPSQNEKTDAYTRYLEYKSAVDTLTKKLEKQRAEQPDDLASLQDLELELNTVMADWQYNGYKKEVEDALEIIKNGGISASTVGAGDERAQFLTTWRNIKNGLMGPPWLTTTLDTGDNVLSINCHPNDMYENHNAQWHSVKITEQEITDLAQSIVETDHTLDKEDIQNLNEITFDYKIVEVLRPWLNRELLEKPFWKLPDGIHMSNPADLSNGLLPAYTTHLFFIKNLRYTEDQDNATDTLAQGQHIVKEVNYKALQKQDHKSLQIRGVDANLIKTKKLSVSNTSKTNLAKLLVDDKLATSLMKNKPATPAAKPASPNPLKMNTLSSFKFTPSIAGNGGKTIPQAKAAKKTKEQLQKTIMVERRGFLDIFRKRKQPNPNTPAPLPQRFEFNFNIFNASSPEESKALLSGTAVSLTYIDDDDTKGAISFSGNIWDNKFIVERLEPLGKYTLTIEDDDEIEDYETDIDVSATRTRYDINLVKRPRKLMLFKFIGALNYKFPPLPNPIADAEYL